MGYSTSCEAGAYIARARRVADLSQRELAQRLGVAPSTVARLENGQRRASAELLDAILALAGLRVAVLDGAGREVPPFPADAVRDNAGRRFPAHLDVRPPDDVPRHRAWYPRYDRLPAKAWYHLRSERDRRRGARGPEERLVPALPDHPTTEQLHQRRRERMYGRTRWWSAVEERRRRAGGDAALRRAEGDTVVRTEEQDCALPLRRRRTPPPVGRGRPVPHGATPLSTRGWSGWTRQYQCLRPPIARPVAPSTARTAPTTRRMTPMVVRMLILAMRPTIRRMSPRTIMVLIHSFWLGTPRGIRKVSLNGALQQ